MILTSNDKKDIFLNAHYMAKRTVKAFPGSDYHVTFSESLTIVTRKTIKDKKEFARILSEGKSKRIVITHNDVILHVPYADREIAKKAGAKWHPTKKRWYYKDAKNLPKALYKYLPTNRVSS